MKKIIPPIIPTGIIVSMKWYIKPYTINDIDPIPKIQKNVNKR